MPRISIAGLMTLILLCGVAFAGLRGESESWTRGMLTLALAVFGVAFLGLLFGRGPVRVACGGYFAFGAGYLVLCIGPWSDVHIMPHLLTTTWIDDRYFGLEYSPRRAGEMVWVLIQDRREYEQGRTYGDIDASTARFGVSFITRGASGFYFAPDLRGLGPDSYRRLCHSAIALLIGIPGALIASGFAARSRAHGPASPSE